MNVTSEKSLIVRILYWFIERRARALEASLHSYILALLSFFFFSNQHLFGWLVIGRLNLSSFPFPNSFFGPSPRRFRHAERLNRFIFHTVELIKDRRQCRLLHLQNQFVFLFQTVWTPSEPAVIPKPHRIYTHSGLNFRQWRVRRRQQPHTNSYKNTSVQLRLEPKWS